MTCKDCLHYDVCEELEQKNGIPKIFTCQCAFFQNKSDYAEVVHGEWHIMPENPLDETESPTEEGWYRIITDDGEETTDYFYNKPVLIGMGCAYWKNCKKLIRAWAKMDAKNDFKE